LLFDLLRKYDYYGVSRSIEFAKGDSELTTSFKKRWKQQIRKRKWEEVQKIKNG